MSRDFDIVIFGSSGVTGIYVVEELIKYIKAEENQALKWAVAGRDVNKTKLCLKESFARTGLPESSADSITVFEANVNDVSSLEGMTAKTRLLLSCVGPYQLFGEVVVKACLTTSTDYVDVTGEPLFMEKMQLNYFNLAKDKGIHIISACGFDSVPADIGVNFLKSQFEPGALNSVETYLKPLQLGTGNEPVRVNHATWDCIVDAFNSTSKLKKVRKDLFKQLFENVSRFRSNFSLQRKKFFKKNSGYAVPFPGSDRSVAKRSQYHNYLLNQERPTEIETYVVLPLTSLLFMFVFGLMFLAMVPFKFGRYLLHKYPEFFTYGVFTHEGPTREEDKAYGFQITFEGKGWSLPLVDPLEQRASSPDKEVVTRVTSKLGGYVTTAVLVVQCAVILLKERELLPAPGGVWTPGIAYRKTSLIEVLNKRGITFEIISSK